MFFQNRPSCFKFCLLQFFCIKVQQKRHISRTQTCMIWVDSQHNVTLVLDLYQLDMYTNVKHIVLRQSPKRPDIFIDPRTLNRKTNSSRFIHLVKPSPQCLHAQNLWFI